jgi:hypothetical protein
MSVEPGDFAALVLVRMRKLPESHACRSRADRVLPSRSNTELRPDIKLILTSAYEMITVFPPPDVPEVAGFIRKPLHLSDLVRLLRDVLATKRKAGA